MVVVPQQAETFGSFIARRRDRLYQTNGRPAIAVLGGAPGFAWSIAALYASAKPPCRIAVLMGASMPFARGSRTIIIMEIMGAVVRTGRIGRTA